MTTTSSSRAGSFIFVDQLENIIKKLQDHLEKVEDLNKNNLQLESTNSDFVWESYGVWKVRKSWKKILHFGFLIFLLEMNGREKEDI